MPSTSPPDALATPVKDYRFRKYYLVIGVLLMALCLTFGIMCTLVALHIGLIPLAIFFGVGLGGLTLLGMCLILVSLRSRLFISPQEIRQVGAFRSRVLNLDEVSEAKWNTPLGGSLLLKGPNVRMLIEFDCFQDADREELIQFFKAGLVEAAQKGRRQFEEICCPHPAVLEMRRRRYFWAYAGLLAFNAASFALARLFGFERHYLVLAAVSVVVLARLLWLAKRRPSDGAS